MCYSCHYWNAPGVCDISIESSYGGINSIDCKSWDEGCDKWTALKGAAPQSRKTQ